jgi:transposase-like protein
MNNGNKYPTSLLEAVRFFSDANVATEFFAKMRWPDGVVCPRCGSTAVGYLKNQRRWQCSVKHPKRQFSAKVGTIFEESPLGLDKWFVAVWCITNAKNGISSCELARALKVTQKSAWFMLHRVRHAMHTGTFDKLTGAVESDETFIGGKAKNMHLSRRREAIKGTGGAGKAIVHGVLQRGGKVRASVIPNIQQKTLLEVIRKAVAPGSNLYTDTLAAWRHEPEMEYAHYMIDHAKAYVEGHIHTNGMENFWSLLKRTIGGTYVSVDAPHLGRYVDEQVFRFNERKLRNDGERFAAVMPGTIGRRITYKQLIGQNLEGRIASDDALGEFIN